jgi:acetoin utilization protein AcuB
MIVKNWMTKKPLTVDASETVAGAWRLMRSKRFRHLPVRDHSKLVGIISDRDIRLAFPSPTADSDMAERRTVWERLRVWQIMTRLVVVVPPDAPMERAAQMLLRYKVSGLPVMADGRLVGIITDTDLLRAFVALRKGGGARRRTRRR